MKTNKLILSAAAIVLGLTACTDLEVPMESQYSALPNSKAAIEANMDNIYFQFRDPLGRRFMEAMTLSSDEYTSLAYSGNWYDGLAYAHPSYHNFSPEDATIDWMGTLGRANVLANEVIESDADDKYKASARAMRAFFTYIMMDCYGDVPIVDESYAKEKNFDMERRIGRDTVAEWLESELIAILPNLSTETTGDNYGKPNKYMAEALLAKLYINWSVYTAKSVADYDASNATNPKLADCIKYCDDIINNGGFELCKNYRFLFNHDNTERVESGEIKEFIYAMPYDTQTAQGMQWGRSHVYKDIKKMNPSYFGEKLNNSGGAYMAVTPECAGRFHLKGDERNLMLAGVTRDGVQDAECDAYPVYVYAADSLLPTQTPALDQKGNQLVLTRYIKVTGDVESNDVGDDLEGWRQGLRSMKWFVCDADYSNGRHQSNDVPILRLADIKLIKAEALVRQGNGAQATAIINEIRERARVNDDQLLATNHTATLDDVYEERGREFFDEIWRRNDMIRFGHYEDEYFPHYKSSPYNSFAKFDATRRVFPISKNDLDLNPKWVQNAGY